MRIKRLSRKDYLNVVEAIFFIDFLKGLSVTLRNLFRRPITT
jgi:NADH-quinone oxidoreductase subunit I